MANMDGYITRGEAQVQDKLRQASDEVKRMGEDFEETKEGLSGMPGGLDSDIESMIREAREQGKAEAEADIESVKASAVADAKSAADTIKTDVNQKITDNASAKSKMEGIRSKYGKSAMEQASAALDQNSQKGEELIRMLDDAMRDADAAIEGVKSSL